MTNEILVIKIQSGDTSLMLTLWEQVERFAKQQAAKFFYNHSDRCAAMGVELEDLQQEAFLGVHNAVEGYNADKGVKFLTYAAYHLMSRFYSAVKLNRAEGKRPTPVSLDEPTLTNDNGEAVSLMNAIPDQTAQKELDEVIERVYMNEIGATLQRVLDCLPPIQRETAVNCFCYGLSYAEYGRQRGVNRVTIRQSAERALRNLRANPEIVTCSY